MKKVLPASALLLAVLSGGCYHAIVETGLQPNGQVIEQKWAMGYAWGLVPPPVVQTAQKCPDGVARVETQHSFMNQVVSIITWDILSPMTIKVECAAKRTAQLDSDVLKVGSTDANKVFDAAVQKAEESGKPVYVQF